MNPPHAVGVSVAGPGGTQVTSKSCSDWCHVSVFALILKYISKKFSGGSGRNRSLVFISVSCQATLLSIKINKFFPGQVGLFYFGLVWFFSCDGNR